MPGSRAVGWPGSGHPRKDRPPRRQPTPEEIADITAAEDLARFNAGQSKINFVSPKISAADIVAGLAEVGDAQQQ
jgi:hypothetical protein